MADARIGVVEAIAGALGTGALGWLLGYWQNIGAERRAERRGWFDELQTASYGLAEAAAEYLGRATAGHGRKTYVDSLNDFGRILSLRRVRLPSEVRKDADAIMDAGRKLNEAVTASRQDREALRDRILELHEKLGRTTAVSLRPFPLNFLSSLFKRQEPAMPGKPGTQAAPCVRVVVA